MNTQYMAFWSTIVPLAVVALSALSLIIVKFAPKSVTWRDLKFWIAYVPVALIYGALFASVSSGIRYLAGLKTDEAYVYVAMGGIVGYVFLTGYLPVLWHIYKALDKRYPL